MRMALFIELIISLKKKSSLLILCLAAILSACGGQNEGMQTLASREVPYFYAVGEDATTQAILIVGNTEGYYREYAVSGDLNPTGQAGMCVGESGRVYIGETNTVYTSSSEDYSSWSSQVIGAGIWSFAATPSGDFLLRSDATPQIWRYEQSSNTWMDKGKTSTLINAGKCLYSPSYYKLLVIGTDGADTYIQELTTATALSNFAYYPFIDTMSYNFFEELNGGIYIGNSTQGLFLYDVLIGPGVGFNSYAVVSPSEIFAGNDQASLPLRLFRLAGGVFVTELIFPGTSGLGFVRLWSVPPDHLIIGVNNSTESDGLYLYDFKKFVLKRLNSLQITALYSSAR